MAKTMLQKFGIGGEDAEPRTKAEPKFVYNDATKFLGSFLYFGEEEPKDKTHKLLGPTVKSHAKFSTLPNAEEVLSMSLPVGFVQDAKDNGWTLAECMTFAENKFAAEKGKTKPVRLGHDYDAKRLAGILAALTPDSTPEELLKEMRDLVTEKGDAAVKILEELLKNEHPRDKGGYIYLRKVKA